MSGTLGPDDRAAIDALLTAARAIGADPAAVLHGGGNASVKVAYRGADGAIEAAVLVKGSGADMASLDETGLTPLSLSRTRSLRGAAGVTNTTLPAALMSARLDAAAPAPSVEALVHAHLPHRFVLHSHADAVQAVTDTADPFAQATAAWGDRALVIDYAMSGVPLGDAVLALLDRIDATAPGAIVVIGHGVFAFGATADAALAVHAAVLDDARRLLRPHVVGDDAVTPLPASFARARAVSALRAELVRAAGMPLVLRRHPAAPASRALVDTALAEALRRGPATPDHVTWAGPRVAINESVAEFAAWYDAYDERCASRTAAPRDTSLGFPRAIVASELGLVTVGRTPEETGIVADILEHTVDVVRGAESLGGYLPAAEHHVHDLEHWEPQRAKFARRDPGKPDTGRIALVTGAASGIGRACAAAYLERGAAVIGWDVAADIASAFHGPRWYGQRVDVSEPQAQEDALSEAVDRFGGLDIVVPAAGIFPAAMHLDALDLALWERTMAVNVTGVTTLFRLIAPLLPDSPGGGDVCVIASKNVAAPGPGAAAYSASKAALTQLARVAALEWAPRGVRVNLVHPDAVFDTALWTPELLAARAEHYGLTVDEYKRRNLLHTEVTSRKVADAVTMLTSGAFSATTGAQIPVDGGNERVI